MSVKYNRTEEARCLLADIEEWCARTGTPENHIGHVLFLHPGFVGLLRKRMTVSVEKEIDVRAFIFHDHPDGWRGDLPLTHANGTRPVKRPGEPPVRRFNAERGSLEYVSTKLSEEEIAARRVDRDACPRCGVRADIGCHHRRTTALSAFI